MTATLETSARQKIGEDLAVILATTYTLFLKTQNFHWNVVDPRFNELHTLFEKQYDELLEQVDLLAERMRMIGQKAPGTMRFFLDNSLIEEGSGDISGDEMIRQLTQDHQTISKWLRDSVSKTQKLGDEGTADIYIEQLRAHDKQAWMLHSHLKERG